MRVGLWDLLTGRWRVDILRLCTVWRSTLPNYGISFVMGLCKLHWILSDLTISSGIWWREVGLSVLLACCCY